MRKIQLSVTPEEQKALRKARKDEDQRFGERALYVLMNAVQMLSTYEIAEILWRDVRNVRRWLQAYETGGIEGLRSPKGAGGRPRDLREQVQQEISALMERQPTDEGLNATHWTKPLLAHACKARLGRPVSTSTIQRVLHDLGYQYKRTRKAIPAHAPTSEEKKALLKSWSKTLRNAHH